jgi:hypothetical protein
LQRKKTTWVFPKKKFAGYFITYILHIYVKKIWPPPFPVPNPETRPFRPGIHARN